MPRRAFGWSTISPATLRSLLVFTLAFAALIGGGLDSAIDGDTTRDLLRARDCLEGYGPCTHLYTRASAVGGLVHGPLWMRFVIANLAVGLSPVGMAFVMIALFALAAVVFERWVSRYFSSTLAPLTCAYFIFRSAASNRALIWNPVLGFLPAAVFYACLSHVAARRGRVWLVASGLALYCCIEAHVSCFVLAPLLVGISMMAGSYKDASLALAAWAIPALLFSREAYAINLAPAAGLLWPLATALIVAGGLATLCRPWWNRRRELHRHALMVFGSLAAYLVALQLFVWWNGSTFSGQYVVSIVPAMAAAPAALFACLIDWSRPWWPSAAIRQNMVVRVLAATLPWVAAAFYYQGAHWNGFLNDPSCGASLRETAVLANYLQTKRLAYDEVRQTLHGPEVHEFICDLTAALSLYAPQPPAAADMSSAAQLRLLRLDRRRLPTHALDNWELVDLPRERVALISPIVAWVHMRPARVFIDGSAIAAEARAGAWYDEDALPVSFSNRVVDGPPMFTIAQLGMLPKLQNPHKVSIELPIVIDEGAAEHVLDMVDEGHPQWQAWVVERVEGVRHTIGPQGKSVTLRADGPRRGTIRFTSQGSRWSDIPLNFVETTPAEAWVRPLLRVR